MFGHVPNTRRLHQQHAPRANKTGAGTQSHAFLFAAEQDGPRAVIGIGHLDQRRIAEIGHVGKQGDPGLGQFVEYLSRPVFAGKGRTHAPNP